MDKLKASMLSMSAEALGSALAPLRIKIMALAEPHRADIMKGVATIEAEITRKTTGARPPLASRPAEAVETPRPTEASASAASSSTDMVVDDESLANRCKKAAVDSYKRSQAAFDDLFGSSGDSSKAMQPLRASHRSEDGSEGGASRKYKRRKG